MLVGNLNTIYIFTIKVRIMRNYIKLKLYPECIWQDEWL